MPIDLYQLPIPDWDVHCPVCRYALRGLPEHRCPECGTAFDMAKLVHTWTRLGPPKYTGSESPLPDFGLRCEDCGEALAGAMDQKCAACGAAFDLQRLRPRGEWFDVASTGETDVDFPLLAAGLSNEHIPHILLESTQRSLLNRLELQVACEFYFDLLRLVAELRSERAAPRGGSWRCPKCHRVVPGNFDVCWKCGAARDEQGPQA